MYQSPPPGYPPAVSTIAPQAVVASDVYGKNPSPNGAAEKRVLYVGNLAPDCTEQMLVAVFAQFGECLACKIIRCTGGPDSYAFMEFPNTEVAQIALTAMNHISLMGRELRVNWATAPGSKPDASKGHHVFVGDLQPDVEEKEITDLFVPFGPIIECKIVRHTDNGFKTYAFLTYEKEEDATSAIGAMNGALLRHRPMRVSQASRRFGNDAAKNRRGPRKSFEEVYNETNVCNTSVYIGGIQSGISEQLLRQHFSEFGNILDVKIHDEKGYGFVRYENHDAATKAIVTMQGADVNGFTLKLGWGKEGSQPQPQQQQQQQPLGMMSHAASAFPAGQVPAHDDPAYQQYYREYMEWYHKYGDAYYNQYYQQVQHQYPPNAAAAASGPMHHGQ